MGTAKYKCSTMDFAAARDLLRAAEKHGDNETAGLARAVCDCARVGRGDPAAWRVNVRALVDHMNKNRPSGLHPV